MRRPWNMINVPIYSLATYSREGANMNICSYVTAVSRKPKLYIVAIEHGSMTLENLKNSEICVLQLLRQTQMKLIRTLGKKTGLSYDKMNFLNRNQLIERWWDKPVIKDCAAYLLLDKLNEWESGDHQLFLFEMKKYRSCEDRDILMWQDLVENGIIL